jgi:hypothetical protein
MCDQMRPQSHDDEPVVQPQPITVDGLGHAAKSGQNLSDAASMANAGHTSVTPDVHPSSKSPRRFGQLPSLGVPDNFDDPLPDAEIAAWEGDSPP